MTDRSRSFALGRRVTGSRQESFAGVAVKRLVVKPAALSLVPNLLGRNDAEAAAGVVTNRRAGCAVVAQPASGVGC